MLLGIASDMDPASQNQEEIDEQARMVRLEVMRGCQLAQELQQKMNLAPPGCLGMYSSNDNGGMIRASLIGVAASIVASFSNVISFLNSSPIGVHQAPMEGAYHYPLKSILGGEMEPQQMANSPWLNSSSPMSSSKTLDSPISGTPPPSPPPIKQLERLLHPSPPFCSTETPPQSPKNRSLSAKRSSPSPQPGSLDSIPATKLPKLEPATGLPASLNLNENIVAETSTQPGSKVQSENVESEPGEQNSNSKRRKYMPKWTVNFPGSSTEQGSEAAPEDGHTWRKYGQKDILGSRHPRSYYRCTYKRELNCPAIKYVQKSDDDTPVFHVTYKGEHTCQATKLYRPRSYSYSVFPMGSLQESQSSLKVNSSCLTLSSSGSLQVGRCGPTFSTTKDFQLGGSFVSSPNSTENASSKSLIFKPTPSFPLPELARTPKFGFDGNFSSNMHLQPKDLIGEMNPRPCADVSMLICGFDPPKMTISQAQNGNIKLSHGDIKIHEAEGMHKLARSNSSSLNRDTSKDFKQSVKQLINHLCLDDTEAYESSADQDICACPTERFSPTTSEVVSNSMPLESIQRSFHDSKSTTCLTATAVETRPTKFESDIKEVVAEHIPSCKFELDFILDSPGSDQQMLVDLHSLLFET